MAGGREDRRPAQVSGNNVMRRKSEKVIDSVKPLVDEAMAAVTELLAYGPKFDSKAPAARRAGVYSALPELGSSL